MVRNAEPMEMSMDLHEILSRDPEIVSGAVVFKGTRVPVEAFFENIGDMSVNEFLTNFPTVERAQLEALLQVAHQDIEVHFGRAS
jgi:uncharacterized protein (DUF433 family)